MTRRPKRKPVQRRGFTLMEVLLVLAILGVIAAMVVPQLMGQQSKAMRNRAKLDIKSIENALKLYSVDHQDQFPQTLDELVNTQPLDDGTKPKPYIEKIVDPWGVKYNYLPPEQATQYFPNGDHPAIWTNGQDGQQGNADDVNNWDELNKANQAQ